MQTPSARAPLGLTDDPGAPLLYTRIREVFRAQNYGPRTFKAYAHWIRRFLEFHGGSHPRFLREDVVNAFLTHLAVGENVAASTQNQALAALLFLYEHMDQPLDRIEGVVRARKPKRLPVVLTRQETADVLGLLEGVPQLVCMLLYGTGARVSEGLRVRVKDLDFGRRDLTIHDGEGNKDRVTMLPDVLIEPLTAYLRMFARNTSGISRADSVGFPCPEPWRGSIPTPTLSGPGNGPSRRHRTTPTESPVSDTGITCIPRLFKRHSGRRCARRGSLSTRPCTRCGTPSPRTCSKTGTTSEPCRSSWGHQDVRTTQIYTHVLNRGGFGVRSPQDSLETGRPGPHRVLY